jgi:hypothetical protein
LAARGTAPQPLGPLGPPGGTWPPIAPASAALVRSGSMRLVWPGLGLFVGRVQGLAWRRSGMLTVEKLKVCRATIAPQNQEAFVDLANFPAIDLIADAHPHDLIAGHVIDDRAWSLDGDCPAGRLRAATPPTQRGPRWQRVAAVAVLAVRV